MTAAPMPAANGRAFPGPTAPCRPTTAVSTWASPPFMLCLGEQDGPSANSSLQPFVAQRGFPGPFFWQCDCTGLTGHTPQRRQHLRQSCNLQRLLALLSLGRSSQRSWGGAGRAGGGLQDVCVEFNTMAHSEKHFLSRLPQLFICKVRSATSGDSHKYPSRRGALWLSSEKPSFLNCLTSSF